jgi:hypothetical protein
MSNVLRVSKKVVGIRQTRNHLYAKLRECNKKSHVSNPTSSFQQTHSALVKFDTYSITVSIWNTFWIKITSFFKVRLLTTENEDHSSSMISISFIFRLRFCFRCRDLLRSWKTSRRQRVFKILRCWYPSTKKIWITVWRTNNYCVCLRHVEWCPCHGVHFEHQRA